MWDGFPLDETASDCDSLCRNGRAPDSGRLQGLAEVDPLHAHGMIRPFDNLAVRPDSLLVGRTHTLAGTAFKPSCHEIAKGIVITVVVGESGDSGDQG